MRYPLPLFWALPPWRAFAKWTCDTPPPPHKRGISAILARCPMKTRQNACDTPLCCNTISKGYCTMTPQNDSKMSFRLVSLSTPGCHNGPIFLKTCFGVLETSFRAKTCTNFLKISLTSRKYALTSRKYALTSRKYALTSRKDFKEYCYEIF